MSTHDPPQFNKDQVSVKGKKVSERDKAVIEFVVSHVWISVPLPPFRTQTEAILL
jgi:hypothetical protein